MFFWTILAGIVLLFLYLYYIKYPWLKYDFQYLGYLVRALIKYKKCTRNGITMVDLFEKHAKATPQKTFVIFQDNNYSYEYMDKQMNKSADVGRQLGLSAGDTIAMMVHNEPAFIWTFYGLSKIGVQPAFLNFNLRSKSLLHCFNVSSAKVLIVGQGDDMLEAVQEILPDLQAQGVRVLLQGHQENIPEGFESFEKLFAAASDKPVDRSVRDGHSKGTCCFIYTSGTTGLPKAAIVTHDKMLKGSMLMDSVDVGSEDILYTAMPLYHSAAGVVALGTTVHHGATLVLRGKFSASAFWDDCRKHNVTVIQYIGELLRYLCAQPQRANDKDHSVRVAFGNGLRQDVWKEFQDRFKVPIIGEFYAATEGNAGFINNFNKFGALGRCSPMLSLLYPAAFVQYDYDTSLPVRDHNGICMRAKPGQPGLMVSKIKRDFEFDGYKGNTELSEKKIVYDVFKKGDKYFNTGDLLIADEEYFLYFSDRIGDTFRWKGENVSTVEVSNVVSDLAWIEDANVYGVEVPGQDGRAGMAAITLVQGHDLVEENLGELYRHCEELLPNYARPRFLRFKNEMTITATYKQRKVEVVQEGFDPKKCHNEPLYCIDFGRKTFVPLDHSLQEKIKAGSVRL